MDKEVFIALDSVLDTLPINQQQKENFIYVLDKLTNSIPKASSNNLGGIKLGYSANGKNYPVLLDAQGKAYVNVPWSDNNTTYSAATTTTLGLVKKANAIATVDGAAELSTLITSFNNLLSNLKAAGIIA